MFYDIRYQTGEIEDIVAEMKNGSIPRMDVDNQEELEWFIGQLAEKGIYRVEGLPYDKSVRDRIKEPEFEFRAAFYTSPLDASQIAGVELMYIDFYFEPEIEETYDSAFGD
ncbi:hypothetical protein DFR58_11692 [Anaerobacterium chartisolvens]|uniref:Uncharacterized protein n=1 Tax=Anaerobacterium chartisolvens TaxID=1297424 RepID=A0A369B094_9FIRM|nr:hypothetical protein [Anaerobacterium chartisolvens]RCX13856.1 hypothetical protein DFR58_11692 [Anaerobacterium chartisolvens]